MYPRRLNDYQLSKKMERSQFRNDKKLLIKSLLNNTDNRIENDKSPEFYHNSSMVEEPKQPYLPEYKVTQLILEHSLNLIKLNDAQ